MKIIDAIFQTPNILFNTTKYKSGLEIPWFSFLTFYQTSRQEFAANFSHRTLNDCFFFWLLFELTEVTSGSLWWNKDHRERLKISKSPGNTKCTLKKKIYLFLIGG